MLLEQDSGIGTRIVSGSSNTAVSISGLVPDSRYMYTVMETNEFGTSSASVPVEIREYAFCDIP